MRGPRAQVRSGREGSVAEGIGQSSAQPEELLSGFNAPQPHVGEHRQLMID